MPLGRDLPRPEKGARVVDQAIEGPALRQHRVKMIANTRPTAARQRNFGGIAGIVRGPHGKHLTGLCLLVIAGGGTLGAPIRPNGSYNTGKSLPAGKYQVEFAPGCELPFGAATSNWASEWYRDKFRPSVATTVVVRAKHITAGISGTMRPGGVISGTVTGQSGHALAGICVIVTTANGDQVQRLSTAASGRYTARGLDPGRYAIGFFPSCGHSSYLPQWWPGTPAPTKHGLIKVGFASRRTRIDARLVVGGTISGTVRFRNRHGHPIKGICVFVNPSGNELAAGYLGATTSGGRYTINGLPAGRYAVSFGPSCDNNGNYLYQNYPHSVTVRLGQVTSGINADLQPGAILTGKVTAKGNGAPLPGICVSFGNGFAETETGKAGTYYLDQIPPGHGTVSFVNCGNSGNYTPQYYPGQLNAAAATPVDLRAGHAIGGIDAALTPGATIRGTMTLASGRKLTNVCAAAVPVGDVQDFGQQAANFFGYFAQSRAGQYAIENLPGGQYQVSYGTCNGPNVADQWFMNQVNSTGADQLNVPSGGVVGGIDAVLQPAGEIRGRIFGPKSQQSDFVCLTVQNAKTGLESFEQPDVQVGGRYAVGGLASGSYLIFFDDCTGANFQSQWYGGAVVPGKATPVKVSAPRATPGIDASLIAGGSISGRVVSKVSGKPLSGICVAADGVRRPVDGFGVSRASGAYRVTGLSAGLYRLVFRSCIGGLLVPVVSGRVRAMVGTNVTGPDVGMTGYRAGLITGRVTAEIHGIVPAIGACVDAVPVAGGPLGQAWGFGTAGLHGYYRIGTLFPGKYKILLGDPDCQSDPDGLVPQWYQNQRSSSAAAVITVKPGQAVRSISGTLSQDGWIAGSVTGPAPAHAGLAGICVRAIPLAADVAPSLASSAGTAGKYLIGPLPPGRYQVKFFAGCGLSGYAAQWWKNAGTASAASSLWVNVGSTRSGVDATLIPRS